ncbi:uncharacterized protein V3H82_013692 [Fundulus diaphanus]
MNPSPTQSPELTSFLSFTAELFFIQLREGLDAIAAASPPWKRLNAVNHARDIFKDQIKLLSTLGISGLFEELEWNYQAAHSQLLNEPPPPRPQLTCLSTVAPPISAVSAAAAVPVSAVSATAAAPVSAVSAAAAAPVVDPAAPVTSAAAVSAAAPDASPSAAVPTSPPGSSRRRRRTWRHKKSPEAKPDIPAEAAPPDVTSLSPVSRPGADAAAQESLARAPRLHEDQLWDLFYGDRDDLLPCWSAPDETPTAYEAGVHTTSPTTTEVPTAHATAQACVGVRAFAESSALPSAESSALPAAKSPALPAIVEVPASLVTPGVPAAHAMAKARVGAHILPPLADERKAPLANERKAPLADERKAPPADERKAPPADERKAPPADERKAPPADERKAPPADERKAPPAERSPQPVQLAVSRVPAAHATAQACVVHVPIPPPATEGPAEPPPASEGPAESPPASEGPAESPPASEGPAEPPPASEGPA